MREGCFWGLVAGGSLLFVAGLLVLALWNASPMGCESRWPDRATRWTIGAGCQVDVDGEWVPEPNVREI